VVELATFWDRADVGLIGDAMRVLHDPVDR